jgi:ABC-type bacteriocin/lantibiotic exporter with double-glycine peptidase domain
MAIASIEPLAGRATAGAPAVGLRRLLLRRLRRPLVEIAVASAVINLLALATPVFMMTVYNKVIGHGALATLDVLAIGMLTLLGFELALRSLRGVVASRAGGRLDALIGHEVVHHLLAMPYRVFERMPPGQLAERLRQLDQLRAFLTGGLPLLAVDLAFVGLFIMALLVLSSKMALLTAMAVPLFLGLSVVASRRQAALGGEGLQATAAKTACLAEALSQALTVKALGLEHEVEQRFDRRLVESARAGVRSGRLASLAGGVAQATQQLAALALIYLGARMVVAGELSVGALVACNILAARALAPVRQLFGAWGQIQQAREAWQRLGALLAEDVETDSAGTAFEIRGSIAFEHVGFRYAPDRPWAVRDLSLEIPAGTVLAVLGPPGSGKTTLIKLLLGLDRPDEGRVLLDGVDLRQVPAMSFHSRIGVVPQDIQLFQGTVAENIAAGAADRSIERVMAAARFVGLDSIVRSLPQQYATPLGERGAALSAGQRQLVALARAIVRNPQLLVLDEATSALDPTSERVVLENLRRSAAGRTVVMVTHRLSLLRYCDRAVVMDGGHIVRNGPASEIARLLRESGERPALKAVS